MEMTLKRIIKIDQDKLEPWFGKIDMADAAIIAYIRDWKKYGTKYGYAQLHPKDEEYVWIDYKTLLKQMPLLKFEYRALQDRLKKLCTLGILRRLSYFHSNGNRAAYYRVPDELFESEEDEEKSKQKKRTKSLSGKSATAQYQRK